MIQLKRVYDEPGPHDGVRFLIERLWPRGIRKADLQTDGWQKEAGPSTQLRKWFGHDPQKWEEFRASISQNSIRGPIAGSRS